MWLGVGVFEPQTLRRLLFGLAAEGRGVEVVVRAHIGEINELARGGQVCHRIVFGSPTVGNIYFSSTAESKTSD